jgi:hypothetical protein
MPCSAGKSIFVAWSRIHPSHSGTASAIGNWSYPAPTEIRSKAAYTHAELLPARQQLMLAWADYLDHLRQGATVQPLRVA